MTFQWCTQFYASYGRSGNIALFRWGVRRSTRPVLHNGWMDCLDTWYRYWCIYREPIFKLLQLYMPYSSSGAWFSDFRAKMLIGPQLYIHLIPGCGTLLSTRCYMYNSLRAVNTRIYGVFIVLWDYQFSLVPAVQHTNGHIYSLSQRWECVW